jgi:hypothetical protein
VSMGLMCYNGSGLQCLRLKPTVANSLHVAAGVRPLRVDCDGLADTTVFESVLHAFIRLFDFTHMLSVSTYELVSEDRFWLDHMDLVPGNVLVRKHDGLCNQRFWAGSVREDEEEAAVRAARSFARAAPSGKTTMRAPPMHNAQETDRASDVEDQADPLDAFAAVGVAGLADNDLDLYCRIGLAEGGPEDRNCEGKPDDDPWVDALWTALMEGSSTTTQGHFHGKDTAEIAGSNWDDDRECGPGEGGNGSSDEGTLSSEVLPPPQSEFRGENVDRAVPVELLDEVAPDAASNRGDIDDDSSSSSSLSSSSSSASSDDLEESVPAEGAAENVALGALPPLGRLPQAACHTVDVLLVARSKLRL